MTERKVLQQYEYGGRLLAERVGYKYNRFDWLWKEEKLVSKKVIEPRINLGELVDLLGEMPLSDRIRLKNKAYAVHKLSKHFDINPEEFISRDEIYEAISKGGYRNRTELHRGDKALYQFAKRRHPILIKFFGTPNRSRGRKKDDNSTSK